MHCQIYFHADFIKILAFIVKLKKAEVGNVAKTCQYQKIKVNFKKILLFYLWLIAYEKVGANDLCSEVKCLLSEQNSFDIANKSISAVFSEKLLQVLFTGL